MTGATYLEWVDSALALEAENAELRQIVSGLVVAILRNREYLAIATRELDGGLADE